MAEPASPSDSGSAAAAESPDGPTSFEQFFNWPHDFLARAEAVIGAEPPCQFADLSEGDFIHLLFWHWDCRDCCSSCLQTA